MAAPWSAVQQQQLAAEERLSPRVVLRTTDLLVVPTAAADGGAEAEQERAEPDGAWRRPTAQPPPPQEQPQIAGFVYELSTGPGRSVLFLLDVTGSENLELDEAGQRLRQCEVAANVAAFRVATLRVRDLSLPWTLQARYTWTEVEVARKEIAPGLLLETRELWNKGRFVTAIAYELSVAIDKRVVFAIDFEGSENLELASGGLRLKTIVEPHHSRTVGYLEVVNPLQPWTLKCRYEWDEELPSRPVLDSPERKELGPGVTLVTTRSLGEGGESFRYQLAVSKNVAVLFTLDASNSANMRLAGRPAGDMTLKTLVQPWDSADVGTVAVADTSRPFSLQCKFTWIEKLPQASTRPQAAAPSAGAPAAPRGEAAGARDVSQLASSPSRTVTAHTSGASALTAGTGVASGTGAAAAAAAAGKRPPPSVQPPGPPPQQVGRSGRS
jgi:hypothetical protein